jgi:lactate permease
VAAIVSMICLALFLRVWHPKNVMTEAPRDWSSKDLVDEPHEHPADVSSRGAVMKAWLPWVILSVFVFLWGTPQLPRSSRHSWTGSGSPSFRWPASTIW